MNIMATATPILLQYVVKREKRKMAIATNNDSYFIFRIN